MTEQQAAILAMEARWWRYQGSKEQAIRDELGLAPIRYYQLLAALIQTEAALEADPVLVNRLRRISTNRQHRGGQQVA